MDAEKKGGKAIIFVHLFLLMERVFSVSKLLTKARYRFGQLNLKMPTFCILTYKTKRMELPRRSPTKTRTKVDPYTLKL